MYLIINDRASQSIFPQTFSEILWKMWKTLCKTICYASSLTSVNVENSVQTMRIHYISIDGAVAAVPSLMDRARREASLTAHTRNAKPSERMESEHLPFFLTQTFHSNFQSCSWGSEQFHIIIRCMSPLRQGSSMSYPIQ